MRLIPFSILLVLITASLTYGATLKFGWSPYEYDVDYLALWERTEAGRELIVTDIPPADTFTTAEVGGNVCRSYFMTAFKDNIEGDASEITSWCPAIVLPPLPITIKPGQVRTLIIEILAN